MFRRFGAIAVLAAGMFLAQASFAQYELAAPDYYSAEPAYEMQMGGAEQVPNNSSAGYEYAMRNGITEPGYCAGPPLFIDGCMAFVQKMRERTQDNLPNTFEAGYRYASQQGIADISRCGGPTQYRAGCAAFAKEFQEKLRLDQWGGGTYDAGYRYATRLDIREPQKCGGPTQAFIDGCAAFATMMLNKMLTEKKQQEDKYYEDQRLQKERFLEEQRIQQKRYEEERYLEQKRIDEQRWQEQQRILQGK